MTTTRPTRSTLVILAVILIVGAAVIMHAGRGTTFFYDDWDFVLRRRGISAETLLAGHNGHLSLVPVAIYKVLLQIFGMREYWPYRLTLVLIHLIAVGGLFALVRRRTGDAAAVCAATLLLFLGAAYDDLIWAFQIGFVGSMAAGLWMLVALDRGSKRGDLTAAVLLLATLGSSSLGVPFAVVAVVELALRRDWRRLVRIVGPPIVLYAIWRVAYGQSDLKLSNLDAAPSYALQMLASGAGALTGLPAAGLALAVAAVIGTGLLVARGPVSPRLGALLVGLLVLLGLTALARAQNNDPNASRYIYATAAFLLLAAAETWRPGFALRGRALAVVVGFVAVAVLGNLLALNQGAASLRSVAAVVRPDLAALDLAAANASPAYQPLTTQAPQINAGDYRAAVAAFGSAAPPASRLATLPAAQRQELDRVLTQIDVAFHPIPTPVTERCQEVPAGAVVTLNPSRPITITAPKDGAPELRLRRYSDTYPTTALAQVPAGQAGELTDLRDRSPRPWKVQITGAGACISPG